ncbi:MAG: ferrochelatase, partial [Anaerolineae bacterium]|nr:ferrochelatase [Anaerolineae bacterium]
MDTIGVLLMAYGGPDSLADIPAYLLDVRGGRPTSEALIEEITENYRKIGGKSPILELSRQQAAAVEKALNKDGNYKVYIGMRHWTPWIREAVFQMVENGIQQAVALVLAPHYSRMSVEKYFQRVDEALTEVQNPFTYERINSYHDHPLLIEALASRVRAGLAQMPADTHVIFSAHSLPVRIMDEGDPYDSQLRETAALVAEKTGLTDWSF